MGGACCIVHPCRHVCSHACNSLIGPKFAHFSTSVNSENCFINLFISFLGIVRHFALNKFIALQPVIASWCVDNFDISYTVCDGFKFDVNNYFYYLSDLLYGCVCYDDFDTLCFDSLNETAAMFHISYVTTDVTDTSIDCVKFYLSRCCLHANGNTALFCKNFSHVTVNLQLIHDIFFQPVCIQLVGNDVGCFELNLPFPIVDEFVHICSCNGS
jgi:hypothetical protein